MTKNEWYIEQLENYCKTFNIETIAYAMSDGIYLNIPESDMTKAYNIIKKKGKPDLTYEEAKALIRENKI